MTRGRARWSGRASVWPGALRLGLLDLVLRLVLRARQGLGWALRALAWPQEQAQAWRWPGLLVALGWAQGLELVLPLRPLLLRLVVSAFWLLPLHRPATGLLVLGLQALDSWHRQSHGLMLGRLWCSNPAYWTRSHSKAVRSINPCRNSKAQTLGIRSVPKAATCCKPMRWRESATSSSGNNKTRLHSEGSKNGRLA
jgi:hypothetical protein